ncbi:MAG TPA: PQQ-binding-like beta-propeller repeat protein [Terriglobia bacterium]|nr:PQQ-binding-like beta-propeller repeat protein [Terriglobia bacterium]
MRFRYALTVITLALLPLVAEIPGAQRGANTRSAGADWPMYNRDLAGTRFSPLTEIDTGNVAKLERAWTYQLQPASGNINPAPAMASEIFNEVTPIVVNGVMYLPAGNRIVALEPETGKEIWVYRLPSGTASFRGVAYWPGDAENNPRILFTSGQKLVGLNARDGALDKKFGTNGEITLPAGYAGVPLVYRNMAFLGAMIFGPGERHVDAGTVIATGPPMNPSAWDIRTGARLWEFHSIPLPGEFGNDTWIDGSWKDKIGPNVWAFALTMDEERGIVYLPIGGPNNNYYGGDRPGANLFANALVAVNAETGKRIWHFQTVHHDLWDYDLPPSPVLFDIVKNGRTIPALAQSGKLGFMFILDRTTGEPVYDVVEAPVAKGDVPGEWYSPTQPIPVKPPPIARVSISKEDLPRPGDTTPEHAAACAKLWEDTKFFNSGPYTPWLLRNGVNPPSLITPGLTGGSNWGGSAYDPRNGFVFINSKDTPVTGYMDRNNRYNAQDPQGQLPYSRAGGPAFSARMAGAAGQNINAPCIRPPWATLTAVNANTGDIAWQAPLGADDRMPEGKQNVGSAGSGGPIATAGGLVFITATNDRKFRAFDSKTGKELWAAPLDLNSTAVPMTYEGKDGRQYVAVVAANGTAGPDQRLVVYALP